MNKIHRAESFIAASMLLVAGAIGTVAVAKAELQSGMQVSADRFEQDFIGQDLSNEPIKSTSFQFPILEFKENIFDLSDSSSRHQ